MRVTLAVLLLAVPASVAAIAQTSAPATPGTTRPGAPPASQTSPSTTPPPMVTAPRGSRLTAEYLAKAAAVDLFARVTSEFILRDPATSLEVKRFGEMLVSDHGALGTRLRETAQALGVSVGVPVMSERQQEMIDLLRQSSGQLRGQMFLTQQLVAHQEALELHRGYAADGDLAELRSLAATAARIIGDHLRDAQRLAASR